ncbi:hypothetical protein SCE1572_30220 [Sorangium cellulosum So0157-2]|uniref:Uncharacterized protein n=1 Tax=Sorangium cellulosum So0157-2 TaxID=1254432 RepID=S4Y1M7_SORCE|nr:hypothetical protein SCE1572_30220 [Sorangium cellulosum So0157-2]
MVGSDIGCPSIGSAISSSSPGHAPNGLDGRDRRDALVTLGLPPEAAAGRRLPPEGFR